MREHCADHESNTKELASLNSSSATIKWILTIGIPVASAVIGVWFTTITSGITEMRDEMRKINEKLSVQAIVSAKVGEQISNIRRDIDELKRK